MLAVNCAAAGAGRRTRHLLERRRGPRPTSRRPSAVPTASNTSCTVTCWPLEVAGQDRAAIDEDRRHVEAAPSPSSCPAATCRSRQDRPARHRRGRAWSARPESAITSRDGSDDCMPSWPMAMPSVTVMVQNSRGVPPAGGDALLHRLRLAHQRDVAGRGLVPARGHADEGLVDLLGGQTHRVVVGPVRRALRGLPSRDGSAASS